MNQRPLRSCLAVIGALCVGVTACGEANIDESGDVRTSTSADRAPRITDNSGRPQVTFDPCQDIPSEALAEAGYEPESDSNNDFAPDEYTFLVCGWTSPDRRYQLSVLSGNITWEEQLQKSKDYSTPITVGSRQALLDEDPALPESCAIDFPSDSGVVIVSRNITWGNGEEAPRDEWCKGLDQTAAIVERYVPKGE